MTVYVDEMYLSQMGRFGRMKMSHMVADSHDELIAMARAIGVAARWIQHEGRHDEHFDVAMSAREKAIAAGAVMVTMKQLACMVAHRRVAGRLCAPDVAQAWHLEWSEKMRAERQARMGEQFAHSAAAAA